VEQLGVEVFDELEPALEGADVVMMLRIQHERITEALCSPALREYAAPSGSTPRASRAKPDAIVMHPGPMNRGVEIDPTSPTGPAA
jgi:aspartate carbamoyltransferase catalytic subunit